MSNEQKLLAKRAKRNAKRKALKQRNAVKKVAITKARKGAAGRRAAINELRDNIFDFIRQKDGFKKFLTDMISGGNAAKATGDAKYDGIIISAYEKGLAKVDELIEPRLTQLAKVVDGINPTKEITTTISEFLEASTLFNEVSVAFNEILETVNKYHNHNVSVYKHTEDPEKIVEFSEDDFNFDALGNRPTSSETTEAVEENIPNTHEDVEVDVIVDDVPDVVAETTK